MKLGPLNTTALFKKLLKIDADLEEIKDLLDPKAKAAKEAKAKKEKARADKEYREQPDKE